MTAYIIPIILISVLSFSFGKTEIYTSFIDGAAEGMKTVLGIFPPILAIMAAAAMLKSSGLFDIIIQIVSPLTHRLGIPDAVMPLAALRPLSGGAALGILTDILNTESPDSRAGLIASVLMGSTETTFYTLCVYFGKTRVKYTKKIIPAAVIGDIVGLISAVLVCKIIF